VRRRGKLLSEAELALWRQVARTVKPLPGRDPVAPEEPEPAAAASSKPPDIATAAPAPAAAPARLAHPPLAPLDRRLRTQLRRGRQGVEAVIDLHGLRQDEAHAALRGFLRQQQARGAKLVLVVTGKGIAGEFGLGEERGVLRRNVPHWLRLPDLRPLVLGFDEAEQRHGGSGALYVRLRRGREGDA
jgi:DNA-nicking Smr family endonuclease